MKRDEWLSALGTGRRAKRPFRSKDLDATGRSTDPPVIEHVEIAYEKWPGKILDPKRDWMGKGSGCVKPLIDGEPEPSCNEIEVAKLLRVRLGYEAYFFTNWSEIPPEWREWVKPQAEMPQWLKDFDQSLREADGGPKSGSSRRPGLPDVVGWNPQASDAFSALKSARFVECKKAREPVGTEQERWFATAIRLDNEVLPEHLAVAVRTLR